MSTTEDDSPPYVDPDEPYWSLTSPESGGTNDSFHYGGGEQNLLPEAFFDPHGVLSPDASPPDSDPITSIVVPILFALIFVVGIIGNSLQVFSVLNNPAMRRSPPNIMIAGLGIGDLLLLLVSVPFAATHYTLPTWIFGTVVCKVYIGAYSLSLTVSVMTLTALSVDRYIAIVHPMTALRFSTFRRTVIVSCVLWTVAVALATVEMIAAHVRHHENVNYSTCEAYPEEWGEWYELFMPTFRFVGLFIIPMILIASFYIAIARVLFATKYEFVVGPVSVVKLYDKQERERKRVAKVVLLFVVMFIVCWLPRHISIMFYYWSDLEYNNFWHVFKIVGICLTFVYSCVNPIALYLFSDEFHRYFDHYLFGRCCASRRIRNPRRDSLSTMFTYETGARNGPVGIGSTLGINFPNVRPGSSRASLASLRNLSVSMDNITSNCTSSDRRRSMADNITAV